MVRAAAGIAIVPNPGPGQGFAYHQQTGKQDEDGGELSGSGQGEKAEPCLIDGSGKGVVIENRDCPEVGQGFHEDQDQAGCNPWPGHGQGHRPECLGRTGPQGTGGFQQAPPLTEEGRAAEQIDIRVEGEAEDQDDKGGRPHLQYRFFQSGNRPEQGLDGTGKIHQAEKYKGHHVGRYCHGQGQGPTEERSAGKTACTGKPAQRNPEDGGTDQHSQAQLEGVEHQAGQLGLGEMGQDFLLRLQERGKDDPNGYRHQSGQNDSRKLADTRPS